MNPSPARPSPFQAILPLCLALLFMAVASPAAPVFRYLEQTGTDSFIFTWRLERERDTATLSVVQRQGSETFLSRNTAAGETLAWQYVHQPDTDVRAEREDDRIRLSGRFQGKTVDEVHAIDDRPWFQPLSFSLRPLALDGQATAEFWTIRVDTLELVAMRAEAAGREEMDTVRGPRLTAARVVIRPDGLLGRLWRAEYWFRAEDGQFIRYRGTHGPPGTPETVISLLDS